VNKVGYFVLDNLEEAIKVKELAAELQTEVNVLLRLNPGIEAHTHEYIQTSTINSKFGESIYDMDKILKIIDSLSDSKFVHFKGFHCHIGSSINQAKSFEDASLTMLKFVKDVEEKKDIKIEILNLGGGFGIKYLDDDASIDLKAMLHTITKTVDKYLDEYNLNIKELLIEPGRSIVGDSCFTLYKAGITKHTYGGKSYLFVDGGMTDNIRPALYQAKYDADIIGKENKEKNHMVTVAGKCCESGDLIIEGIMLPEAKKGDLLITYTTGAYGYSMSSNYNKALTPAVVFVEDGKDKLVSRRQTLDELIEREI
jgi:diaminopimelate decarboxylase